MSGSKGERKEKRGGEEREAIGREKRSDGGD